MGHERKNGRDENKFFLKKRAKMKGSFNNLKELTDGELSALAASIAHEQAIRAKREAERAMLPPDHRPVPVIIEGLDQHGFWSVVHARIANALETADLHYETIFVDLDDKQRATVRFELPSEAARALSVLKQEFSSLQYRIYILNKKKKRVQLKQA